MFSVVKRLFQLLVVVAVAAAFLVFSANNYDEVEFALFPLDYSITMPKFLFALVCFALGTLVGGFFINLKLTSSKRQYSQEHKRVKALQDEVQTLHEHDTRKLTVT